MLLGRRYLLLCAEVLPVAPVNSLLSACLLSPMSCKQLRRLPPVSGSHSQV